MRRLRDTSTLVGSALVLALVVSVGCASTQKAPTDPAESLRAAIESTVPDEGRRTELLARTDQWAELIDSLAVALVEARETLEQLVADYDSRREDFDAFFADYESRRADLGERIIELHVAMKELTTDEEWRSLERETQQMTTALLRQDLAGSRE
jgi:predicted  nucleic acid-binding Zn-ribbon protein